MDEFCREKGFAKWFETSAKENINIETSTRFLIDEVSVVIYFYFELKLLSFEQKEPEIQARQESWRAGPWRRSKRR